MLLFSFAVRILQNGFARDLAYMEMLTDVSSDIYALTCKMMNDTFHRAMTLMRLTLVNVVTFVTLDGIRLN